jgi:GT2 family glycosyltransferase
MDVSIIIINYKTPKLVANCLQTILEKTKNVTYEAIIVDNSSEKKETEQLQMALSSFAFAKIVVPSANLGFGGGNNFGASFSFGDYLLFLNSDTLLMNNAIYNLFSAMKSDSSIGVAGANLYSRNGKPGTSFWENEQTIDEIKRENRLINIVKKHFHRNDGFNYTNERLEIFGLISGACMMIPKKVFKAVEGFDKDIFMYGEDSLICKQIKTLGYSLVNIPNAKIIHLEGGSDNLSFSERKIQNIVDGTYIFYTKAYGKEIALKYLSISKNIFKRSWLRRLLFLQFSAAKNSRKLMIAFDRKREEIN